MKFHLLLGRPVLLLVTLTTLGCVTVASRSPVSLIASLDTNPSGRPGGLTINCSLDLKADTLDKVFKLTLLGSSLDGSGDDFDQLAVLDVWSKSPIYVDEQQEEDVSVDGIIGSDISLRPYLALSWNQPPAAAWQIYKCVAKGLDNNDELVTLSATVRPESNNGDCYKRMDAILEILFGLSRKVGGTFNLTEDVMYKAQNLDMKFGEFQANATIADGKTSKQFVKLTRQLKELNDKFQFKIESVAAQVLNLANQVPVDAKKSRETLTSNLRDMKQNMIRQFRILNTFDVSDTYKDRMYLVTKTAADFNIASANHFCRLYGGYLVELDDFEEYQFVSDLVSKILGANSFYTGGNDIDSEGTFVYYNSKKPVPQNIWTGGKPSNSNGNEHCMEIRIDSDSKVNDFICTGFGKYVCEVPLN